MEAKDMILICKALSDTNRLEIVQMLSDGEKCGCKILDKFNITQPTLSHHMKILVDCGLVNDCKEGKWHHYSLKKKIIREESLCIEALERNKKEMKEECIICKAPLIYLEKDEMMECVLCHKKELSKTRCEQGHYVCNECHTKGMGVIIDICLSETSKNPIEIIRRMMAQPFCHMHGPEHHVMVGSALLTAYKNAGGEIDLPEALLEMMNRGKAVPGGVCGFWGACGAGISTGMFISIISGATPLKNEPWGLANKMTSKALDAIGSIGGPRCCKRDSYIAIISAIDYVAENFNIQMEKPVIKCIHSDKNNQCIKERCPFHE